MTLYGVGAEVAPTPKLFGLRAFELLEAAPHPKLRE
jgi:hypothetical protein